MENRIFDGLLWLAIGSILTELGLSSPWFVLLVVIFVICKYAKRFVIFVICKYAKPFVIKLWQKLIHDIANEVAKLNL